MKTITKLTLALSLAYAGSAAALDITIGHVDSQDWTISKKGAATQVFKNLVEAESGGRINVNIYPSGQLGGETELLQSTQEGMLTMTMVSGAYSKLCKEANVLEIPYLFPSAPIAWEVLDGEFGQKLNDQCLKTTGLRNLAYGETGFRHFTNSKREITTPQDLNGLKIRVMTTPLYVEMMKSLDAEPTPIAFPEVPAALTTGVIDGQENPVSVINANKFYELQKYITLDGHVYGTDFLLMNDDFYTSLNAEDRAIIDRAAKVAGTVGRAIQQVNSAEGLEVLAQKGMKITSLTPEQQKQFRDKTQPAVIKWLSGTIDSKWIDDALDAVETATN
ncbi:MULTISPECIES: TRAP transporter substrate-binding protein [Vibrio]|uniref:Trap dicarboxylate transporter, dctp subunit n=1 Tax=Vibrio coralliirubri TaxID=1516159 RepID=A0AA87BZZ0_9VIBR|nr:MULTISPECIES: DctP family TRAP transporter solute-binding subunit [Vibrio]MDH5979411.1 DctP family TRAP transporter solute-binding subunit [Vibrio splendidus]CDT71842.1 Trap dicarboxylate transporter, dctp subunit [Vibrio coralliirubri]CDT81077.1 Trap dicarboxylate transporter, dctp subunit [Vibrio coralliirubri]CDT86026.1 Trap dicarboxylate transporter, dctp subunit [Vibrio coralliirubri]CDU12658.1 Trap dicarboxylate transporter, dctp subunit [Vibrio coralliirubri]